MFGISIVICCYNSADRLPETLKSIANQQGSNDFPWEVILVNNNSTDNTIVVAHQEWSKHNCDVPFHVVEQPIAGLSFAREKGIEVAKFEYILFCDDDNWLDPGYLAIGASVIKTAKEAAIIGGRGEVVSDAELPDWYSRYNDYYATFPQAKKSGYLESKLGSIYGAGMFLQKSAFQKLKDKGFESILTDRKGSSLASGGDYELCYAIRLLGYKLYYDDRLIFKHFIPAKRLTEKYLIALTSAIGYSSTQLTLYHYLLIGHPVNKFTWVKDFIYKIKYVVTGFFSYALGSGDPLDLKVRYLNNIQGLKSMWDQRNEYLQKYRKLKNLMQG